MAKEGFLSVKKNLVRYSYFILLGLAGMVLLYWLTPYGAGVTPDSIVFISGAQSLLSGEGFSMNSTPITHFPPLYPYFLAAAGLIESDLVQAARVLNSLFFGLNLGLVALAVYLTTGRNVLASTLAVLFFLSSKVFLLIHASALSEPIFIAIMVASIILLSMYIEKPTLALFIASSLCMGCAIVTRYIGIAFLPAAAVMVFLSERGWYLRRGLRNALIWSLVACVPLCLFVGRNLITAGSATNRSLAFHFASPIQYIGSIISSYLFTFLIPISPTTWARWVIYGFLALFLITFLVILFRKLKSREMNLQSMNMGIIISCLLFSAFYLIFLFISISLFDAHTPVDGRILSPIFVISMIGAFSSMWFVSQALRKPGVMWAFFLLVSVSILVKTPDAIRAAMDMQQNGVGFTSRQWQNSASLAYVRMLEQDVLVYSNGSDVVNFLTGVQSQAIPKINDPHTQEMNPEYDEEIDAMCKDIYAGGALLVYFSPITWRAYFPTLPEIEFACPMSTLMEFDDGVIYGKK